MKVIVDTCVWSLFLRRKHGATYDPREQEMLDRLREAILARRVVIAGPVRQEILSGIREPGQFARTAELLEPFKDEAILGADYIEAARLFNLCRSHGKQCGTVDMLLCALAARMRYGILTSDQGLQGCIQVLAGQGVLGSNG